MDEDNQHRDALRIGLRRAGLHWLRAGYEVVAGVGAFLDEVARTHRDDLADQDDDDEIDGGPIRIELD